MSPTVKNILAVIVGVVIGAAVNMGLIQLGMNLVPLPEGVDGMDPESIAANIHRYELKHFIFPFLAHALGTLVGAFIAAKYSVNNHMKLALVVGAVFLAGGIMMVLSVPGPTWFAALDLIVAYFPMAWLGWKISGQN